MNYEIRPMEYSDAQRVLAIFEQGINGGNATFDKVPPPWEAWDTQYFKVCRFVLENENNEVVGWCALHPVSKRDCFRGVAEVSIYLDQSVQGKGLGKILLEKLILASEEHQFWTLQSGIFPENQGSIVIHEKMGFRRVGFREKMGEMNGRWRDIILLERRSAIVGT